MQLLGSALMLGLGPPTRGTVIPLHPTLSLLAPQSTMNREGLPASEAVADSAGGDSAGGDNAGGVAG